MVVRGCMDGCMNACMRVILCRWVVVTEIGKRDIVHGWLPNKTTAFSNLYYAAADEAYDQWTQEAGRYKKNLAVFPVSWFPSVAKPEEPRGRRKAVNSIHSGMLAIDTTSVEGRAFYYEPMCQRNATMKNFPPPQVKELCKEFGITEIGVNFGTQTSTQQCCVERSANFLATIVKRNKVPSARMYANVIVRV